jgi:hypothetical protein
MKNQVLSVKIVIIFPILSFFELYNISYIKKNTFFFNKNKTSTILQFIASIISNAQVGVDTTTPAGALDISSNTNELLHPRAALTTLNISAPVGYPQDGYHLVVHQED